MAPLLIDQTALLLTGQTITRVVIADVANAIFALAVVPAVVVTLVACVLAGTLLGDTLAGMLRTRLRLPAVIARPLIGDTLTILRARLRFARGFVPALVTGAACVLTLFRHPLRRILSRLRLAIDLPAAALRHVIAGLDLPIGPLLALLLHALTHLLEAIGRHLGALGTTLLGLLPRLIAPDFKSFPLRGLIGALWRMLRLFRLR